MTKLLHWGTALLALGLMGLGIGGIVLPEFSSSSYGVATDETSWVAATSLRDLALGVMTLGFLKKQPGALPIFLLALMILPLGDIVIVLSAGQPLSHTAPHVLGAAIIAGLAIVARKHRDLHSFEGAAQGPHQTEAESPQ